MSLSELLWKLYRYLHLRRDVVLWVCAKKRLLFFFFYLYLYFYTEQTTFHSVDLRPSHVLSSFCSLSIRLPLFFSLFYPSHTRLLYVCREDHHGRRRIDTSSQRTGHDHRNIRVKPIRTMILYLSQSTNSSPKYQPASQDNIAPAILVVFYAARDVNFVSQI